MTGRDSAGTRPPMSPIGVPFSGQGNAYIPPSAAPGYGYGSFSSSSLLPYPSFFCWNVPMAYSCNQPAGTFGPAPPQYVASQPGGSFYYMWPPYNPYANVGIGGPTMQQEQFRQPQPQPSVDSNMPAAQMTNSSGGVGCEPGYNYFFPAEHTKCHIFYSRTAPWQLPAGSQIPFKATHVPCTVTMAELLKGFGACNDDPKKNRCYEITPGGNGTWYRGINFSGTDKNMMGKTMKDVGWDMSRSGNPGEKAVVCLWFCKS